MNELRPKDWIEAQGKDVRCPKCGDRMWVKAAGTRVWARIHQGIDLTPSRPDAHVQKHHRCTTRIEFIVSGVMLTTPPVAA